MAKNPLGKIKDLTVDSLKSPRDMAGKAVGQARGAASVGRHLAGQATKSATSLTAGAVSKLVSGRKLTVAPAPAAPERAESAPATEDLPTPVNVTEELGLDPAPVDAPQTDEPLTAIDAEADASTVDVTPADVAKAVARKAPVRKPAATKAPAAKKAPARKSAPGAKLPPRKKVEQN